MGKFQIKKIERKEALNAKNKEALIKLSLQTKPLLETIPLSPSKKNPLRDGTILFGKHRGEKISDLLNSYEDSSYVFEYLMTNKDLPKKFRNQIGEIINNQDPFDSPVKTGPMKTRCVGSITDELYGGDRPPWEDQDEDDIPW